MGWLASGDESKDSATSANRTGEYHLRDRAARDTQTLPVAVVWQYGVLYGRKLILVLQVSWWAGIGWVRSRVCEARTAGGRGVQFSTARRVLSALDEKA